VIGGTLRAHTVLKSSAIHVQATANEMEIYQIRVSHSSAYGKATEHGTGYASGGLKTDRIFAKRPHRKLLTAAHGLELDHIA